MIDREVAIKTIRLSLSAEELALYEARFEQEIKTVGKLNNPHIVTIYDVGRTEQFAYMAMELIDGCELKACQAPGRPMDPATAVDIAAQVADGLAFAHSRGIVHRDVKPSNIMLSAERTGTLAKIMDFGIARAPTSTVKTAAGMVLGSPRYMSPEQVIGKNVGPHSDVFSLGAVLYEMLTGIAPFDADSVSSIMYQTVHVREEVPSRVRPGIPPYLDAIVGKALAKSPEGRYATMKDFWRTLRDVAKTLPEPQALVLPERAPEGPAQEAEAQWMITLPPAETAGSQSLAVAPGLDSIAGTMRLAELTGNAEVTAFFQRHDMTAAVHAPDPAKAFPVGSAALLGVLALTALVLAVALLW